VLLTVAPEVTIIPIRTGDGAVSNDPPYPYWLDESIAAGIHAAIHRGVQVINISAGIDGHPVLEQAIDAAIARGIVVVAAAGRYARIQTPGTPFAPSYPASYPQVVSAGTFGIKDGVFTWWAPLHPSRALDILTPGVDVLLATPSYPDSARLMAATGSSLSAPVATGIVALMMAADSATPAEVRRTTRYAQWIEGVLQRTANPRLLGETGFTEHTGFGAVNAAAAVAAARAGVP
jgi:subtilisin family serine protease